jgi:hypothetical protein
VVGALESLKTVQVADGWVSSLLSLVGFDIPFNFQRPDHAFHFSHSSILYWIVRGCYSRLL